MPAPSRTSLADLPKGHRFPSTTLQLSDEYLSNYLDAVQDANPIYRQRGLAPPLAVAALAIGSLLQALDLPAGTLHTGQELDMHAGVPIGASLTLSGGIAQRSERAGTVIWVIEFAVTPAGASSPALTGRTTVLAPAGGSPS